MRALPSLSLPGSCARYVLDELCLASQCPLHHKHSKCLYYFLNQMRGEKLLVLAPILVSSLDLGGKGGRDGGICNGAQLCRLNPVYLRAEAEAGAEEEII